MNNLDLDQYGDWCIIVNKKAHCIAYGAILRDVLMYNCAGLHKDVKYQIINLQTIPFYTKDIQMTIEITD